MNFQETPRASRTPTRTPTAASSPGVLHLRRGRKARGAWRTREVRGFSPPAVTPADGNVLEDSTTVPVGEGTAGIQEGEQDSCATSRCAGVGG